MKEMDIRNKVFNAYLKREKGEKLSQDEKDHIAAWELMKKAESTPAVKGRSVESQATKDAKAEIEKEEARIRQGKIKRGLLNCCPICNKDFGGFFNRYTAENGQIACSEDCYQKLKDKLEEAAEKDEYSDREAAE